MWNFRIVKHNKNGAEHFEVCEVYYDETGVPHSFVEDSNPLKDETVEALRDTYKVLADAMKKSVLVWDGEKFLEDEQDKRRQKILEITEKASNENDNAIRRISKD
jgi:hypothetical protein